MTEKNIEIALPKLEQLANEMMKKTGVPGMAIAVSGLSFASLPSVMI